MSTVSEFNKIYGTKSSAFSEIVEMGLIYILLAYPPWDLAVGG